MNVPGSPAAIDLVPVAGALVPAGGAPRTLWFSRTEIPWEVYDLWILGLDPAAGAPPGLDALSRPSKPYVAMDRGFGHVGHPAISMSARAAREFPTWLSAATGVAFRLPTEAEWERACRAGRQGEPRGEGLDGEAWHRGNSGGRTHAVGSARPAPSGLHDLLGNAAEWCVAQDGELVVRGGSWRDAPEELGCAWRAVPSKAWNASDPQVPKSRWWLADAPFVGLRVVCEEPPAATAGAEESARGGR